MKLADFKGEEAFKVMGRTVTILKRMFADEKVLDITINQNQGWILDFFEYTLDAHSKEWLDMFVTLNPDKKAEDVNPLDVVAFALDFQNDEQLMSLFFSLSRTKTPKTSSGSAMANTEVGAT